MSRGIVALAAAMLGTAAGADAPSPFPPGVVLMLVAPWCAPCHGEIARADALAAAARPHALLVMAMDDGPRARAMVRRVAPALRWEPAADTMRRARADALERAAGLPYSIATDDRGRICADRRGGLDDARVRDLVARCRARFE